MHTQAGESSSAPPMAWLVLLALALAKVLLHFLTNGNYGYFRDELYYIDCAKHLDWGYVDHPPLSLALLWLTRALLGDAIWAIRLPAVLAGAATVVLAGCIARELGAGRFAQGLTALAVFIAPVFLSMGTFFSMNSIDHLFWAGAILVFVRIMHTGDPRGWLLFGLLAGLGLQNKISVLFLGAGITVALLLTPERRHFRTRHLYLGGLLAVLILLPNLIWQLAYGWPTFEFMRNAALYKNAPMNPLEYASAQILLIHPFNVPLWVAGLLYGLFATQARRYRVLAVAFLAIFLLLALGRGKPYYLAPAFLLLLPLGARWLERATVQRAWVRAVVPALLLAGGAITAPMATPLLPPATFLRYQAFLGISAPQEEVGHTAPMPQHLADRFGWREKVELLARVYHALPESDQKRCAILAWNYGQAGAVNFFGPEFGLPQAISPHNNHYLWGYGAATGEIVLMYAHNPGEFGEAFEEVTEVARFQHPYAMPYETNLPLFLCRGLKKPIAEVWPLLKDFG